MQSFLRDQKGQILILYALCLIPILLAVGGALDYANMVRTKRSLQFTVDAAVLSGAAELPNADDALAAAIAHFDYTVSVSGAHGNFQVVDGVITGTAGAAVGTLLMQLAGIDNVDVGVTASAANGSTGMELMLVLDVSGSMSKNIPDLRLAATNLLDVIFEDNDTRADTWVGLTPFGGRVNIIDYGETWMNSSPSMSNGPTVPVGAKCKIKTPDPDYPKLCTALRSGVNSENAAVPSVEGFDEFGGDIEVCPVSRAVGLTSSRNTVQQAVDQLCAGHGTSTQVGMVWGWRMVSPDWQGLWGDPELPLSYADTPGKYVLIMTDGKNHPNQSDDPFSTEEADEILLRECQAMKDEGIIILAVTFNMGGALSELYQQCASDPAYQFDAESGYDLEDVFGVIGNIVNALSVRLID
ncbi:MAG: pilus assembly protein [Proteobacteria bacterium]|nr:pilus assembly protein [Pseudomonadota bacterium]